MRLVKPKDLYKINSLPRLTFNYFIIMILCYHLPPGRLKNWLLRRTGANIGRSAWLAPHTLIDPLCPTKITVEDGAFLGWGARLYNHTILPAADGDFEYKEGDGIVIKAKGFVGGYSTVHQDVTIEGILLNNSVAQKDIPEDERWGGVPAKRLTLYGD